MISGVTLESELFFECHRNDLSGTEVISFVEHLLVEVRGRIVVLWDNINIHRSVEVATFLQFNRRRLRARRLPPYAPELNPDEAIWDVFKNDRLANYCPAGLEELGPTVISELAALKTRRDQVLTAMRQTELPIHTVDQLAVAGGFN